VIIAPPITAIKDLSSAIRGQAFPAHPHFPQLKTACDPASMLEIFRANLRPTDEKVQIQACAPVKLRLRNSGARCLLQYVLRLVGSNGTRSNAWVTCVIYAQPGEAEKAWTEQSAADSLRTIPASLLAFEPLALIPDLQMLVQVFPHDRLIPNLPAVVGGPWPELERLLLHSLGPGQWRLDQQTVEPLRYLAGDTAVLRYTLTFQNPAEAARQIKRFYVKVYRTRHGADVFRLLRSAREEHGSGGEQFAVVEPLTYCAERRCLVLHEAPGRSLQEVLLGPGDPLRAVRGVALALAAFHQSGIPATSRRSAEEQVGFLNRAAELLCWACPASSGLITALVEEVGAGLGDVPAVPIHWDLKSDHIFIGPDRVLFVDLDTVCLGDPARDPAHLAAHIACRIDLPHLPAQLARSCAQGLVEEYFAHVPDSWREQFNLQYVIAALEAACGLFKRQESGWPERAAAAIEEAGRALSNGAAGR
jgi:hypothetical protein